MHIDRIKCQHHGTASLFFNWREYRTVGEPQSTTLFKRVQHIKKKELHLVLRRVKQHNFVIVLVKDRPCEPVEHVQSSDVLRPDAKEPAAHFFAEGNRAWIITRKRLSQFRELLRITWIR